jgi:hypothetical protein
MTQSGTKCLPIDPDKRPWSRAFSHHLFPELWRNAGFPVLIVESRFDHVRVADHPTGYLESVQM